jgi:hypothetical protein
MADDDMFVDDLGMCMCTKHRRVRCDDCGFDFTEGNEIMEISLGLRRQPTRCEEVAKEKVMIEEGIRAMREHSSPMHAENLAYHLQEMERVDAEMAALNAEGKGAELLAALRAAGEKAYTQNAERSAVIAAWSRENPGKTHMEWGGAGTQRLRDQVASLPPSAGANPVFKRDAYTCSYCKKSSITKLKRCARCMDDAFCTPECQQAAWKGHKLVCRPTDAYKAAKAARKTRSGGAAAAGGGGTGGDGERSLTSEDGGAAVLNVGATVIISGLVSAPALNGQRGRLVNQANGAGGEERWVVHIPGNGNLKLKPKNLSVAAAAAADTVSGNGDKEKVKKKKRLPLTWDQLAVHEGRPAMGQTLEVRVMVDETLMRTCVFGCKDRAGVVKRVAAYTENRSIAGMAPGKVLRWKNPRYHWFMDGSTGARIEQGDLANISVTDG